MAQQGVNLVILIGNLGRDPETRYLPSGGAVTNITVATSESWKDKTSGQMQERTEWHRVVFFNKLAEIAGEYLKKGSKVYLQGKLVTRQWEKDGQKHYTTEIHAHDMQMLDARGNEVGPVHRQENHGFDQPPARPQSGSAPRPQAQSAPAPAADFDDDIPF